MGIASAVKQQLRFFVRLTVHHILRFTTLCFWPMVAMILLKMPKLSVRIVTAKSTTDNDGWRKGADNRVAGRVAPPSPHTTVEVVRFLSRVLNCICEHLAEDAWNSSSLQRRRRHRRSLGFRQLVSWTMANP